MINRPPSTSLGRPRVVPAALVAILLAASGLSCSPAEPEADLLITGGLVFDGSGAPPLEADVAVRGDRILAVGDLEGTSAHRTIDASGMAVTPGFINMLSWATTSLLEDGTGLGDLVQGVTLEVFGEGVSMGPLDDDSRRRLVETTPYPIEVDWTTLGDYLESLERRGVAPNVASFVGATTVRTHVLGYEDRPPTSEEMERMKDLVDEAMREGALGLGSSLIYPPAFFASTDELIELCRVVSRYDGLYISHMRSEGDRLVEAVEELVRIAREADVRAEIYHLKAAGEANWGKLDRVFELIEAARAEGLEITADMYLYTAGATGLTASLPPWVQEGGFERLTERLRDPSVRMRVEREMSEPGGWENLLLAAGSAENVLIVGVASEELKQIQGLSLAEVARRRGTSAQSALIDLILEDGTRVEAVYFLMSEDNLRRQIEQPWMSFGSDAAAMAPRPPFTDQSAHPRAYGNFARLLGRFVREQEVVELAEAIRRLTSLPAENLGIEDRGRLEPGAFADLVVFDPDRIEDRATFEEPHQLAVGVDTVVVNGRIALEDGQPTGELPGRVVRGPGWSGPEEAGEPGSGSGSP